jgi:hypothetical protein
MNNLYEATPEVGKSLRIVSIRLMEESPDATIALVGKFVGN